MAEASAFSNFLSLLAGVDAFTLMFPFVLAWLLYYAAIEKVGFFDEIGGLDNAAPIVSLILAFFTARFLVVQPFYQSFFSVFFGKIVIGLGSLLGLYTLLSFTGFEINGDDTANKVVKWIAAAMAGAAFIWAGGFGPAIFSPQEIGGGLGAAISALYSLVFETGAFWLIIIVVALGWLMMEGNNNEDDEENT